MPELLAALFLQEHRRCGEMAAEADEPDVRAGEARGRRNGRTRRVRVN
jgi:hypothetical protein